MYLHIEYNSTDNSGTRSMVDMRNLWMEVDSVGISGLEGNDRTRLSSVKEEAKAVSTSRRRSAAVSDSAGRRESTCKLPNSREFEVLLRFKKED